MRHSLAPAALSLLIGISAAPALAVQTDAPSPAQPTGASAETVATGLENPWGLTFLPSGDMLVTERPGRVRFVTRGGTVSRPVVIGPAEEGASPGHWYGIVIPSNAQAYNVTQVDIGYAYRGVSLYDNDHIVAGSTIHNCSDAGVWVSGGTPSVESMILKISCRVVFPERSHTMMGRAA